MAGGRVKRVSVPTACYTSCSLCRRPRDAAFTLRRARLCGRCVISVDCCLRLPALSPCVCHALRDGAWLSLSLSVCCSSSSTGCPDAFFQKRVELVLFLHFGDWPRPTAALTGDWCSLAVVGWGCEPSGEHGAELTAIMVVTLCSYVYSTVCICTHWVKIVFRLANAIAPSDTHEECSSIMFYTYLKHMHGLSVTG